MTAPNLAPLTITSSVAQKLSPDSIPISPTANNFQGQSGYWLTLIISGGSLCIGDYDVSSINASAVTGTTPPMKLQDDEELWGIASSATVTVQRFATNVKTGPIEGWDDNWGDLPWAG